MPVQLTLFPSDIPADFPARFWAKFNKTDTCWLWTGAILSNGYGRAALRRRPKSAHRLAWELTYGPIPAGLQVCHHCDVRNCGRPDHLFLGTALDNMRDAARKGRIASGERHSSRTHPELVARGERNGAFLHPARGILNGRSKFTQAQIDAIRLRHAAGGVTKAELAREFGVVRTTIGNIINGNNWTTL